MYKYIGLIVFLLVIVMAGFSIYQAIITGSLIFIIFSIILVVAVILQLRKMIHITVTYEDEVDNEDSGQKEQDDRNA